MKVFISWSGEKSGAVAKALRDWLPNVIQAVQPWMSDSDIDQGTLWTIELGSQLQESRIGVICLTSENLTKPSVLFEAGALSNTVDRSYVCPYLIDLSPSDLTWPLSMFQS